MQVVLIIVASVVGGLAAVVGGLYFAGRVGNGATREASIEIAAAPEGVWRWLVEPERVKQWVGGLTTIESLTPDKGLEVGARDRLVVELHGSEHELFTEVTQVEPGRALEQRLWQSGPLAWHEVARFAVQGLGEGRARFTVTASYTYTTFLGVVMLPIIRVAAAQKLAEDLSRLRGLVEGAPR